MYEQSYSNNNLIVWLNDGNNYYLELLNRLKRNDSYLGYDLGIPIGPTGHLPKWFWNSSNGAKN